MAGNEIVKVGKPDLAVWKSESQRLEIMEEAAIVWNLDARTLDQPKVVAAINQAIRLCARYALVPGKDVFLVPFRDKVDDEETGKKKEELSYSVIEALSAWEKYADRAAYLGKFHWQPQYRKLGPESTESLRQHLQKDVVRQYGKVKDVEAWECRIFRLDIAREFKDLGVPYDPEWYVGYVYKSEKKGYNNSTYETWDCTIPKARTPEYKAKQRALRHALSRTFTQTEPTERLPVQHTLAMLQDQAAAIRDRELGHDSDAGNIVEYDYTVEDDDGMVWAAEPHRSSPRRDEPDESPEDYQEVDFREQSDESEEGSQKDEPDEPANLDEIHARLSQEVSDNLTMSGVLHKWAKEQNLPNFGKVWGKWNAEHGPWVDAEDQTTWEVEFIAHILEQGGDE